MNISKILLSNDDGNRAIGSRVLIQLLKDKYELVVAGPKNQQSSVGASITAGGFSWGVEEIDGVKTYWVDGTPSDSIELVYTQEKGFDLVIAGINWGPNISTYLYRSGTYQAVTCTLGFGLAPYGMTLNWDVPSSLWRKDTDDVADISGFLDVPGKMAEHIFKKALEEDMWGAQILNINFPSEHTLKYKFTKLTQLHQDAYDRSWKPEDNMFYYKGRRVASDPDENTDSKVLSEGSITITPCKFDFTDYDILKRLG